MTAWPRVGGTVASPSRLARAAPPLRGCGLERLPPLWRVARMRSWVSITQEMGDGPMHVMMRQMVLVQTANPIGYVGGKID